MAVQTVPYALQNASHSAALFRQSASAAFVTGGALGSAELLVTQQGSPNMSVILGAGRAKVTGTSVSPPAGQSFTTQAMYDTLNDAAATLTIAASNPTNPRIDLVYIQVQDSFYSGASNQAIAGVVTGTPAPSPSVPATPANAVAIATVAVGAGVTSIVNANISRVIARASLLGRYAVADLDALAALASMGTGDSAHVAELGGAEFEYSGTAWVQITPAVVASSSALTTAYAKASGAYQVQGRAQAWRTDLNVLVQYFAAYNNPSNMGGALAAGWYPIGGNVPLCHLTKTVAQNGGTSATAVQWNNTGADLDRWGMYSTGNNTRVTISVSGWYTVTVTLSTTGTVARTAFLRQNGSTNLSTSANFGTSGAAATINATWNVYLAAGDYIEVTVTDASAGLSIGTSTSMLEVKYDAPASI